jgi:1-deoxy-D-xylulose-5-phosphate synthase
MRLDSRRLLRLGIPDRFIEHGERDELLADLRLDSSGIATACQQMLDRAAELDPETNAPNWDPSTK